MFADVPGYAALLLRRTYSDLSLPGALMDRAHDWLGPTAARWHDREKTWTFPSGATLTFGYLEGSRDHYRYQGAEFQRIGFDELTQFKEDQYRYLRSRLRRTQGMPVQPGVRSASNPGGEGHEWVYEHFVVGEHEDRRFVPATLDENPHLDAEEYERSLEELDDTTKAQLRHGLWVTDPRGKPFKREHFRRNRFDPENPPTAAARVISLDTAVKAKEGSDYTACVVSDLTLDNRMAVREVWEERLEFPDLPDAILETATKWNLDGKLWRVIVEDKGSGSSALQTLWASAPEWLATILVPYLPKLDKLGRGKQAAVWGKRGCVLLPHPSELVPWLPGFERQLFAFPDVAHDDEVDAFSQKVLYLEHILSDGWRARGMSTGDGVPAGRAV